MTETNNISGVYSYFKMTRVPFTSAIPVESLCKTTQFDDSFKRLSLAAENRQFAVLTSEPGCGKSTLLRAVSKSLSPDKYFIIYISESNLSPRWLYSLPLERMQIEPRFYTKDAKKQFHQGILRETELRHKSVVMIVDEAHTVSGHRGRETLEEIRFLLNCDYDCGNPICLILSGQNELWNLLGSDKCRAIAQRIDLVCRLPALDDNQVRNYIASHLQYACAKDSIFTDDALNAISAASKGIPRIINKICTHALLYTATAAGTQITSEIINEVVEKEIPKCLL